MKITNSIITAVAASALAISIPIAVDSLRNVRAADHAEAPAIAQDSAADIADVYLFLDPNDNSRVIMAMTLRGFIVPGENVNLGYFDPNVRYTFELELTGDAKPDHFIDVRF